MSTSGTLWTNEQVLDEFLRTMLIDMQDAAFRWGAVIRDAASDPNPALLRDRLAELQMAVLVNAFSIIDGASGPTYWPGIKLVNAQNHTSLSDDLCWELSRMESAMIGLDKPIPEE